MAEESKISTNGTVGQSTVAPVLEEKVECTVCKKLITKKNISTHMKTLACKAISGHVEEKKPVSTEGGMKIKERFDIIDEKLDMLLTLVGEMYEDDLEDDLVE